MFLHVKNVKDIKRLNLKKEIEALEQEVSDLELLDEKNK